MRNHRKILGVGFVILGPLMCLSAVTMFNDSGAERLMSGSGIGLILGFTVGVLQFAGGYALLSGRRSAWWLCGAAATLLMLAVPVGTAMGVYYFWYRTKVLQQQRALRCEGGSA